MDLMKEINFDKKVNLITGNYSRIEDTYPSRRELIKIFLREHKELEEEALQIDSFFELSQYFLDKVIVRKDKLLKRLQEIYSKPKKEAKVVKNLIEENKVFSVINLNYDTSLDEYPQMKKLTPFTGTTTSFGQMKLYKPLGDFENLENVIVTKQDIRKIERLSLYQHYFDNLKSELRKRENLIVGVDADDLDFFQTIAFILGESAYGVSKIYLITEKRIKNEKIREIIDKYRIIIYQTREEVEEKIVNIEKTKEDGIQEMPEISKILERLDEEIVEIGEVEKEEATTVEIERELVKEEIEKKEIEEEENEEINCVPAETTEENYLNAEQYSLFSQELEIPVIPEERMIPEVVEEEIIPEAEEMIEEEIIPEAEEVTEEEIIPKAEEVIEEEIIFEAEEMIEEEIIPEAEEVIEEEIIPEAEEVTEEEIVSEAEIEEVILEVEQIKEEYIPKEVILEADSINVKVETALEKRYASSNLKTLPIFTSSIPENIEFEDEVIIGNAEIRIGEHILNSAYLKIIVNKEYNMTLLEIRTREMFIRVAIDYTTEGNFRVKNEGLQYKIYPTTQLGRGINILEILESLFMGTILEFEFAKLKGELNLNNSEEVIKIKSILHVFRLCKSQGLKVQMDKLQDIEDVYHKLNLWASLEEGSYKSWCQIQIDSKLINPKDTLIIKRNHYLGKKLTLEEVIELKNPIQEQDLEGENFMGRNKVCTIRLRRIKGEADVR